MNYRLGFYINPHNTNRTELLDCLYESKIKYIGTDGCDWHPEDERNEIDKFAEDLKNRGIRLYATHACSPILAMPDRSTPAELFEEQINEIKRAAIWNAKTIVYHACWMRDVKYDETSKALESVPWNAFVDLNAETITKLANEADKYGINLVFENTNCGKQAESFKGFADIIQAVDKANVGFLIDTGHAHIAGDNLADEVAFAGQKLLDTHLHDNMGLVKNKYADKLNKYADDLHLPPGLGTINWPEFIRELNKINYSGPLMFEGVFGHQENLQNGYFKGKLSFKDIIELTINNWRAFELLASHINEK